MPVPKGPGITLSASADGPEDKKKKGNKGKETTPVPTLSAFGEAPENPLAHPKGKATVPFGIVGGKSPDGKKVPFGMVGGKSPEAEGMEEEEAEAPEITDAEVLAGLVPGKLQPDPHLTTEEPQYFNLFKPDKIEDSECILRLYKLKNQVGTKELQLATGTNLTTSISEIAAQATTSLIENLGKQSERTDLDKYPHARKDHYSTQGFAILDVDTQNIHAGITIEKQDNKTIIKLPPKKDSKTGTVLPERAITTWPDDKNNRIMYSASGTDPYSLTVFKESILKGAKALLTQGVKANFIIFIPPKNPNNFEAVARLCAMANCMEGLTPTFQTSPGCNPDDAREFKETFIRRFAKPELIRDPNLEHPEESENTTLKEAAEIIKPLPTYNPPPSKYLSGSKKH